MNQALEEIKRMAESQIECEYECQELATYCLRMIKALEKCQLQRNTMLAFYEPQGTTAHDLIRLHEDKELTKILEGKDE